MSGAAMAAVCEAAARCPGADRPACTVSTGICLPTRPAARPNLRGLPNDSTYSTASSVTPSCSHQDSMSLLDTSSLLPTEANDEIPMPSRERRVQANARDGHAEAVRPNQPHVVLPAGRQQAGLLRVVEPGRDDDEDLDAPLAAFLRGPGDGGRRHRDYRKVHRLGQRRHRPDAPDAVDLAGVRVHRVDPPGETSVVDVSQDRSAD